VEEEERQKSLGQLARGQEEETDYAKFIGWLRAADRPGREVRRRPRDHPQLR
jgi:hypothetical protein